MTVTFMGLIGPSGVLPRHYTELLIRHEREAKGQEKLALRAWLDLFNHRLISLLYRAWEKYRFFIPYERGEYARADEDAFTRSLLSFLGLGQRGLRNRLRVATWEETEDGPRERALVRIDDLALLYYSGYLSHRPRCAVAMQRMLQDYFQLPVQVQQFQGQWLYLDPANQSCLSPAGPNNGLGTSLVVGERVWDVQNKVRLRLGPLSYEQFSAFLPDRSLDPRRKAFFLLSHLTRLYIGPQLDYDVQLVLRAPDVPMCQLGGAGEDGPRLGWNTWIHNQPFAQDADDPVFDGEELVFLNQPPQ
jgi:type VI secretion system protein ImpH